MTPWWLRVVWVCHLCSELFVGCVVSRVLCVVCWLFLAMIRTYYVVMYVVRQRISLLLRVVINYVFFFAFSRKIHDLHFAFEVV